jgi:hypothetical protein
LVADEYTSVVDRTVAQIGSAALAKTIRSKRLRFIAVTCHEDVEPWLNPDWVYRPAEAKIAWRELRRRPPITLRIRRCATSQWRLFAHHHYLSHSLAHSAVCFLATWQDRPVCFSSWLPFFGKSQKGYKGTYREHRTVCLPDYQGVGIGNAVSDCIASMWTGLGYRALSTTTHPAMIGARKRSPNWNMVRKPSFGRTIEAGFHRATNRLTAGFAYIGPRLNSLTAKMLYGR